MTFREERAFFQCYIAIKLKSCNLNLGIPIFSIVTPSLQEECTLTVVGPLQNWTSKSF